MLNQELRKKLKKVDTVITELGYHFDLGYGSLFIVPNNESSVEPTSWVRMHLRKFYSNNEKICSLYFYAEPCRLSGGSGFMTCDFAEVVCAHWKRLLNACNTLNELKIEDSPEEIKECVRDILARKRK